MQVNDERLSISNVPIKGVPQTTALHLANKPGRARLESALFFFLIVFCMIELYFGIRGTNTYILLSVCTS